MDTLASAFSSREVMVHGDGVDIYIRVPVPEGFPVKFLKNTQFQFLNVNFIPPVEVHLKPTCREGFEYEARVSCVWMSFKQLRQLSIAIDLLWSNESSLEDNVEALLNLATNMLEKLRLSEGLDLVWRDFGATRRFVRRSGECEKRPAGLRRTCKNLVMKVGTNFPKTANVPLIVQEYDSMERRIHSIPGISQVRCLASAGSCQMDVLPTRCLRASDCPADHTVCYRCMLGCVQAISNLKFPICISIDCNVRYQYTEIELLLKGRKEMIDKIEHLLVVQNLAIYNSMFKRYECPWCHEEAFPEEYVKRNSITVCRSCDSCWCEKCLTQDLPESLWCPVKKAKQLYEAQVNKEDSPEAYKLLFERYSQQELEQIKEVWENQEKLVYDQQCCPNCFSGVHKTLGCNHMVCHCGQDFCYLCGAPMDPRMPFDHFDDDENCKPYVESLF